MPTSDMFTDIYKDVRKFVVDNNTHAVVEYITQREASARKMAIEDCINTIEREFLILSTDCLCDENYIKAIRRLS